MFNPNIIQHFLNDLFLTLKGVVNASCINDNTIYITGEIIEYLVSSSTGIFLVTLPTVC